MIPLSLSSSDQPETNCRDWVESRLGFRDADRDRDMIHTEPLRPLKSELLLHNPGLPLLKTDRRTARRATPPASHSGRREEPLLVQGAGSSAPPPLLNLSNTDCETSPDSSDTVRRKPTPDLLELSSKYETIHRQNLTRTQSGPSRPKPLHQEQPRPWSDTARLGTKPRQLEPIVNPPHLVIPRQRGLNGLHLSVNYSGQSVRTVLEPILAISQQGEAQEEDTTV